MRLAQNIAGRRNAFTLVELLVVLVLILVIASIGIGYIVFGQDNQHSVNGAQAITGALLNAKQRARRDGLPTGVRLLFGTNGLPATQAGQLELVQQPEDYNAGQVANQVNPTTIQFSGVDFQGGAQTLGTSEESTVAIGDYFILSGSKLVHQIVGVSLTGPSGNIPTLSLASPEPNAMAGSAYSILRAPRRLPSEDLIQLPPGAVIENGPIPGNGGNFCQNLPVSATSGGSAEIVFAPSGAVVGQGTGADKVFLWLRDPNIKPAAFVTGAAYPGVPLILSVQIRTGLIGVYSVGPWGYNTPIAPGNDPYAYVKSPHSSGL